MTVGLTDIINFLEELAPVGSALQWDNPGLQLGDPSRQVEKVQLSLDLSMSVLEEALEHSTDLIITHHPLIFRPLRSIDYATPAGRLIRQLITHNVALFAAHTNLDCSTEGTGRALAEKLNLQQVRRYSDEGELSMVFTGRFDPPCPGEKVAELVKESLGCPHLRVTGQILDTVTVAVIPGSGGSLLRKLDHPFDLVITGEVSYHEALDSAALGQAVAVTGHYHSEKPVMYHLKKLLTARFPSLKIRVAEHEGEPFSVV